MDDATLAARALARQRRGRWLAHGALGLGVVVFALPIWITLVGSTHEAGVIGRGEVPLLPGREALANFATAWGSGGGRMHTTPAATMLLNSAVRALSIALGKILISVMSA